MARELEMRAVPAEIRADESGRLEGTGVPYGSWSEDLGGFRERFLPGAFAQSIAAHDIRAIFNHNPDYVLGRKSSGTLTLTEDAAGLQYSVEPPDTSWADDLMESIRRGDIRENSFAFWVEDRDDEDWEDRDGVMWRTIKRATMRELGPQTFPAYPQSTVAVRSIDQVREAGKQALAPTLPIEEQEEEEQEIEQRTGRHPAVLALETELDHEPAF